MNNFFRFLVSHTTGIVFLLLEGVAALLIIVGNDYQRSAYLSSANVVAGAFYNMTGSVSHYFGLSAANEALVSQNMELTREVDRLKGLLAAMPDSLIPDTARPESHYHYMRAHAVGLTTNRSRNMITLDEGARSGISQDMAVVNAEGVVGLVSAVSQHFAVVLPLINTSSHLSVKIKGSNHRGQLVWDGLSPRNAMLNDIPEHAIVEIGDTIQTSGASAFFPEGLMVGVVNSLEPDRNGGFLNIGVKLAVDYNALYDVQIIEDYNAAERVALEADNSEKQ